MTVDEALQIIKEEHLGNYMLYTSDLLEDAAGIKEDKSGWVTYMTSERAAIVDTSYREFDNESDALEEFIERLRRQKRIADIDKKWAMQDAERRRQVRESGKA